VILLFTTSLFHITAGPYIGMKTASTGKETEKLQHVTKSKSSSFYLKLKNLLEMFEYCDLLVLY